MEYSIITLGKENDDEKTMLRKIIWLYQILANIIASKVHSFYKQCALFV